MKIISYLTAHGKAIHVLAGILGIGLAVLAQVLLVNGQVAAGMVGYVCGLGLAWFAFQAQDGCREHLPAETFEQPESDRPIERRFLGTLGRGMPRPDRGDGAGLFLFSLGRGGAYLVRTVRRNLPFWNGGARHASPVRSENGKPARRLSAWLAVRVPAVQSEARLGLGIAAVGTGIVGQLLLSNQQLWAGGLCIAAAVLSAVWVLGSQPQGGQSLGAEDAESTPLGAENTQGDSGGAGQGMPRPYWLGLLAGGIVMALAAFGLFDSGAPAWIPWLLHLTSIMLLLAAVLGWDAKGLGRGIPRPDGAHWSRVEIAAGLVVLAAAVFLRLYRLDQLPYGVFYDEAQNGLEALRILNTPGYLPVFVPTTLLPAHLNYLIALSLRILGVSAEAVRAVSVLFGVGTVAAAYLAGRELFNRRMGLALAFFLAVSRWDLNWSRIGMHGISVPFFELLTVGLLLRGLRRGRLVDYVLAGISLGFSLCFYFAMRLFPLVLVFFLGALWLRRRDFVRSHWTGLLALGLGACFAANPLIQSAVFHPEDFLSRTQTVSIFNGKTPLEGWQAVAKTSVEHLLMFNYQGDRNGRHNLTGEPMLDPISAALMVLGVGLCLRRIRQPKAFLLLAWLLLMLAPGIFSLDFESPQSYRAIGSLPAVYLLAVVPLEALWQEWERAGVARFRPALGVGVALLLGAAGYLNFHVFFDLQAQSDGSFAVFSTQETYVGRLMARLGNQVDYYISAFYYNAPTIQFLAPQVQHFKMIETQDSLPLALEGQKGAVLIVDPDREPYFRQAQLYYPNAVFNEFKTPQGQTLLYEVQLKPEDITSIQGLTARYFKDADWEKEALLERKETRFNFDWRDGDPLPFPFGVEWQGILFAPGYGRYEFSLENPAETELFIDGGKLDLSGVGRRTAAVQLARGNHAFKLRATAAAGHFELTWQPPGQAGGPVPASSLLVPSIGNHGLLGRYFANGDWQEPVAFTQIDPWIHFYFHNPALPRPYTVEWSGKLYVPITGSYKLGLESIDDSALYLDEQLVIGEHPLNQLVEATLDLSKGFHPIRIRFGDRTGSTHINLYWQPPHSEMKTIPQEALYPPEAGPEMFAPVEPPAQLPDSSGGAGDVPAQLLWQVGGCGSAPGQFLAPHGLAVDPQGNLWIADSGNARVVELGPDGKVLLTLDGAGNPGGKFHQPFDLGFEADGTLVVLDADQPDILQRFDLAGKFLTGLGRDLGTYNPRGLAVASSGAGDFYIADTGGARLLRLTKEGLKTGEWRLLRADVEAGQPVSVSVGPDGIAYVVDIIGRRIWRFLPDGSSTNWPAAVSGDSLNGSRVAVGEDGRLYLSDPDGQRLVLYSPEGKMTGQLSGFEHDARPVGVAPGKDGLLYVGETGLCRVSAFKLGVK